MLQLLLLSRLKTKPKLLRPLLKLKLMPLLKLRHKPRQRRLPKPRKKL